MNRGQVLLQFPMDVTENGALKACEAKGYRVAERNPSSVIGFYLILRRGRTLAALAFDKAINRWTLVEAIR